MRGSPENFRGRGGAGRGVAGCASLVGTSPALLAPPQRGDQQVTTLNLTFGSKIIRIILV